MGRKLSKDIIIADFISTHINKYSYNSFTEVYIGINQYIKIICPIHGVFEQKIKSHRNGKGCMRCSHTNRVKSDEIFISEANSIHNNKYKYVDGYGRNAHDKIRIECPIHGLFKQSANKHLMGSGCPMCGGSSSKPFKDFINDANIIHNNKYRYLDGYISSHIKMNIECSVHGVFSQTPHNHLTSSGCIRCYHNTLKLDYSEIMMRFEKVHNNRYVYAFSDLDYNNKYDKIEIICEIHGVFKQSIESHFSGSGCPKCNSSKGELFISNFLDKKKIHYMREKKFDGCVYERSLSFDFFLPQYNMCIEYDGKQHYESIEYFGGDDAFIIRKKRDKIKTKYCKDNNIILIRIPYWEYKNIELLLSNDIN